jgi:hypothetical protein
MDGVEEAREVGTTTYSKKLVQVPVAESVMVMVIIVEVALERRDQREMTQPRPNKVVVNKALANKVLANKVLANKVVAIIFLQGDKGWVFGLELILVVVVVVKFMHDR